MHVSILAGFFGGGFQDVHIEYRVVCKLWKFDLFANLDAFYFILLCDV